MAKPRGETGSAWADVVEGEEKAKSRGGGIAWADVVELEEKEKAAAAAAASGGGSQNFPSLKEAVSAKPKKKKMTLTEFYSASGGLGGGPALETNRLTPDEMLRLPTGPKERSADEMQYGRLGGGFSSYGRGGQAPGRMRDRDDNGGSWGGGGGGRRQYGGFDEERRGPPSRAPPEFDQPSRADEVDNWAMAKKPLPSLDSGRSNRYGSLGGGGGLGGGSRADDVDNWATSKKPTAPVRSSTFGSGFRDSGPEPDRWSKGGGNREFERERPRLVLNPPKADGAPLESIKTDKPNPFGAARPREQVLAEKGLDWKKLDFEIEAKKTSSQSSRPTSAHSSRPSSAHSARSESLGQQGFENVVSKPRPKVNPFGDAKPREVLLEERGKDWRKIDLELEHRRVDRPESEEEKLLKDEIEQLKKEQQALQDAGEIQEIISHKEKELEQIIRDLDDKVRFGPKAVERPGSGAGRVMERPGSGAGRGFERPGSSASRSGSFSERPPSQSGSFDEARSVDYGDRPRSRGNHEGWARPGDDRRPYQGGRARGFGGNRDFDRPSSRERW